MSTPAGKDKLMSESMVFGVGSTMSTKRLCVRISNWSRLSLCTKAERLTVYFFFSVGSGIGPITLAPDLSAVSMIIRVDWSMIL